MNKFKIVQISDIHIPAKNIKVFDIDVRKNFIKIIEHLKTINFDILIITGDLSYRNGEIECYTWIKNKLLELNKDYYLIPGNHDNVKNIAKIFNINNLIHNNELYYTFENEFIKIIFLDSSKAIVSKEQIKWLLAEKNPSNKQTILFMHHPPAICGNKYMDKNYKLENIEEMQKAIIQCKDIKNIFCGHYHDDKIIKFSDRNIFITPSTWFQINENELNFKIKSYKIGWRIIEIMKDSIRTEVFYL